MSSIELRGIQTSAVDQAYSRIADIYGDLSQVSAPDSKKRLKMPVDGMIPIDGVQTPFDFKRLAIWHAHLLNVSAGALGEPDKFESANHERAYEGFMENAPYEFQALCKSPAARQYAFGYIQALSSTTYYGVLASFATYSRSLPSEWRGVDKGITLGKYVDMVIGDFLEYEYRTLYTGSLDEFLMFRIRKGAEAAIAGMVKPDLELAEDEFGLKYAYLSDNATLR